MRTPLQGSIFTLLFDGLRPTPRRDALSGLKIFTLAFALLAAPRVFACMQIPDTILHNENKYPLFINPLEAYFKNHPDQRERLRDLSFVHEKKLLTRDELLALVNQVDEKELDPNATLIGTSRSRGHIHTGLYRGYIATFEIKDKQLFVIDIVVEDTIRVYKDPMNPGETAFSFQVHRSVFKELFPDGTLKADWVTGLVATMGEPLVVICEIEGYKQSKQLVFEFQDGNLVSEQSMTLDEYTAFENNRNPKAVRKQMNEEGRVKDNYWLDLDNWDDDVYEKDETRRIPDDDV